MERIVLLLCLSAFLSHTAGAQTIDLLSGDLSMPVYEDEEENKSEPAEKQTANSDEDEDKQSFFSFITKPISKMFSADDEVVDNQGKKETFLEQSLRLAEEGNVDSQMNLGYMYLYGSNGVEQDFEKAFHYYNMAAEQNNPIALNNLGSLYFNGIGVTKERSKAMEYFSKSAELGNDNAATNLAFIYLTGGDVERNKKAIELLKMAAKNGNKLAKFMLGYAHYKGFLVERDNYTAFDLIKEAAGEGAYFDEAQYVLAEMYANGYGTVQNYVNAVDNYTKAVDQGNTDAYFTLAKIYTEGRYAQKNLEKAHTLFNIAASEGDARAAQLRDSIGSALKLEVLLHAQTAAQSFKPKQSELTSYVRQTFGTNVRNYIDKHIQVDVNPEQKKEKPKKKQRGSRLL